MTYRNKDLKSLVFRISSFTAIIFFVASNFVFAQPARPTSTNSGNSKHVEDTKQKIETMLQKVRIPFREGLVAFVDRNDLEARRKFDRAVEVFLMSGINVRRNQKLRECYNQLIETIYRIEFPASSQSANILGLSTVCGWSIKPELAERVAKRIGSSTGLNNSKNHVDNVQAGFSEQKFEPSPRDELAKFEFTKDETNIDSPEARKEFRVLRRVAERNNSLGFTFQMHPMVQRFLNYYRGRGRRTMENGLNRSGLFMSMARRIFREEGVPENVAWLGQVESAWKPTARSHAAAAGLWQFIPGTGRRYGLRRTSYIDERQSFEKATRASARYLRFLANRYRGNWELAMGAYNCGEGNVDRAIRRAGTRNFWAAYRYLPRETRNYVPNILAVILIANNPYKYGFGHIRPARPLRYDRIRIPASTRLGLIAQASDTSVQYLRYLNPELRTNMTPPEPYIVRVPLGKGYNVVSIFRKLPRSKRNTASLANSSKGETWTNLSRRTGVTVAELRRANPGMVIPRGRIIVPNKGNGVRNTSYSRPRRKALPKGIKVVRAKSGDTVEKLAMRHKASPVEVAKFNGLFTTSRLNAGREIKIPPK